MSEQHIVRRKLGSKRRGKTDLKRLRAMTEAEIDAAARSDPDAQPTTMEDWKDAVLVFPGGKGLLSLRIDNDIVKWFKSKGPGYQTRMNAVLRSYMDAHRRKAG
jgi:uncharacterized protein (DUF4415 family)